MLNIKRPTLIIDESQARRNIKKMIERASKAGCSFRPHFKTHQSSTVGSWFKEFGIKKITCSSVRMASYFASHGWNDITIAFPYNRLEIEEINNLNDAIELNVLIESESSLKHLESHVNSPIGYFVKIDAGYHRTGLGIDDITQIKKLTGSHSKCEWKGLLIHSGNTYRARTKDEIISIHDEALKAITIIKNELGPTFISYGDTPSCSVADNFGIIDELRPGNFVYYDLMQKQISSCQFEQIAVAVACPVVAIHEKRNEIVIYGGAVHLSKDYLIIDDQIIFGKGVRFTENGWEILDDMILKTVSQEHGVITCTKQSLKEFKEGDIIGILPIHSCLAADLLNDQQTLDGKRVNCIHNEN